MTALPDVTSSNPANLMCLSGNYYTVQSGDDVQKIAAAHGIATARTLNILNGIFPDGTNLFTRLASLSDSGILISSTTVCRGFA